MDHDEQARALARILATPHDEAACRACLDGLEAYVDAQLAQANYAAQFPAVAAHLDSCVACAEAYALLYEIRLAVNPPTPAFIPPPDLSFLPRPAPLDRGAIIAQALEQLGNGVRLVFSKALLDAFAGARGPALAMRSGVSGPPLVECVLDQPTPTLSSVQITVYAAADAPERCTIRIQVERPGREWPDLAGTTVSIHWPDGEALATTDAWGEAIVADVPREHLAALTVTLGEGAPE